MSYKYIFGIKLTVLNWLGGLINEATLGDIDFRHDIEICHLKYKLQLTLIRWLSELKNTVYDMNLQGA